MQIVLYHAPRSVAKRFRIRQQTTGLHSQMIHCPNERTKTIFVAKVIDTFQQNGENSHGDRYWVDCCCAVPNVLILISRERPTSVFHAIFCFGFSTDLLASPGLNFFLLFVQQFVLPYYVLRSRTNLDARSNIHRKPEAVLLPMSAKRRNTSKPV